MTTVAIDNGLARDVENNIQISVPVRWMGVNKLELRLDDDGIMIVGISTPESYHNKGHVVGTQFVPYKSLVEHEILNHWNRY